MLGGRGWDRVQVHLLQRRPGHGQEDLGLDAVAQLVGGRQPRAQIAALAPGGQAVPRLAIAHGGDGHHVVGGPGAVGVIAVPEQAGVVPVAQHRHPAVAEGSLELLLAGPDDAVHLVDEQHERGR